GVIVNGSEADSWPASMKKIKSRKTTLISGRMRSSSFLGRGGGSKRMSCSLARVADEGKIGDTDGGQPVEDAYGVLKRDARVRLDQNPLIRLCRQSLPDPCLQGVERHLFAGKAKPVRSHLNQKRSLH